MIRLPMHTRTYRGTAIKHRTRATVAAEIAVLLLLGALVLALLLISPEPTPYEMHVYPDHDHPRTGGLRASGGRWPQRAHIRDGRGR